MGRPKLMDEGTRLSVVLSKAQIDRVRLMAIRMSSHEGRQISVSEAVRMAVEAAYPVPKPQKELF